MKELNEDQKKALVELDYSIDDLHSLLKRLRGCSPKELLVGSGPLADAFTVCGLYGAHPITSCDKYIGELRRLCTQYTEVHKSITVEGDTTYLKLSTAMALRAVLDIVTYVVYTLYDEIETFGCGRVILNYSESHYEPNTDQWPCLRCFVEDESVLRILDKIVHELENNE